MAAKGLTRPKGPLRGSPEISTEPPLVLLPTLANGAISSVSRTLPTTGCHVRPAKPTGVTPSSLLQLTKARTSTRRWPRLGLYETLLLQETPSRLT